jgi:hypothetical protein
MRLQGFGTLKKGKISTDFWKVGCPNTKIKPFLTISFGK